MPGASRGFFYFKGSEDFARHMGGMATVVRSIEGHIARLADDGGGFLSAGYAAQLAGHIQGALASSGTSIGGRYDDIKESYKSSLAKIGQKRKSGMFNVTGGLYESIKVLNRRYATGRGAVVGIDPKAEVPHYGWGGYDGTTRKVSQYAAAITFGSFHTGPGAHMIVGRPVIPEAIEHFLQTMMPKIEGSFYPKLLKQMQDAMDKTVAEIQRNAPDETKTLSKQESVAAREVRGLDSQYKKELKKDYDDMIRALKESGASKEVIDHYKENMKDFL